LAPATTNPDPENGFSVKYWVASVLNVVVLGFFVVEIILSS
jgi:hypothetical protein